MTGLLSPLLVAARYGRLVLVLGLVAGIALPGFAEAMKAWISECVMALLFTAALRVGPRQAVGALRDLGSSAGLVVILQTALPIVVLLVFRVAGFSGILATGLVLMASAPPISGSPNLAILTGNDPAPALRQMVLGTALLPFTVIPVFWLEPSMGEAGAVLAAAGWLLAIICLSAGAAFAIRHFFLRDAAPRALQAVDGLSAIVMAVVVVALMSAVGPAFREQPAAFALNVACAFAANLGLQIAAFFLLRRIGPASSAVPLAIGAGNRNVALFLAALPAALTDPLLLFIGCYQIPMYLTPLILGRLYRAEEPEQAR